ncbi:MAG: hypothetical protein U0002_20470 [Thermoanaerobaculia bacterium]
MSDAAPAPRLPWSRLLPALAVAFLGLAGLAELSRSGRQPNEVPLSEVRAVAAVESLELDHDFAWGEADRPRALARWGRDLLSGQGGKGSAQPPAPLSPLEKLVAGLSLPAFLLAGPRGLVWLPLALHLGLLGWAARRLPKPGGWELAGLAGSGVVFGPFAALLRPGVASFEVVALFAAALVLGRRGSEEGRAPGRWRPALPATLLDLALLALAALAAYNLIADSRQALAGVELGLLPRLAGAQLGLVPAYPFVAVAALSTLAGFARRGGARFFAGLLLFALGGWVVLSLWPLTRAEGLVGDPSFALLAGLSVWGLLAARRRWPIALGWGLTALFTLPALVLGLVAPPERAFPLSDRLASFRPLPFEAALAVAGALPGYREWRFGEDRWYVPAAAFFADERHRNGVWVRGDSSSEVVIASRLPLGGGFNLRLHSIAGNRVRLRSGEEEVSVTFDSLAKKQGTPVSLPLAPLPGPGPDGLSLYRLQVEVEGGLVPTEHDPKSRDRRYLGVFLDLAGGGP